MTEKKWFIAGYVFQSEEAYRIAKQESESIIYIKSHTNLQDMKQVLKLYNKAVEGNMFQTVIGYEFLHQLYAILVKNKVMEPQYLRPIAVRFQPQREALPEDIQAANKRGEQYRYLYENALVQRRNSRIVTTFLAGLILAMIVMVYFNYRTYDENAILDKYASWEQKLEEREQAVREKEKALHIDVEESQEQGEKQGEQ
ncbi:MAG: hypothetical protein II073_08675 [Lachnospiraceae bacterium]|nr:hypothetical protein [Lachnospiraceae bacterium]